MECGERSEPVVAEQKQSFWKAAPRVTEHGILRPEVDCGFAESNEGGALQKKDCLKLFRQS